MKTRLMMLEPKNSALDRAIVGLRRCHLNNGFRRSIRRRRLSTEQSYDESSNKKASIYYSSALGTKQQRHETYGLKGKAGCWCPPGFCRCRIKTPMNDSNRTLMPMFPCKCPPGFLCRCQMKTPVHDSNRVSMAMFPCICPPGFLCRCQINAPVHDSNRASMAMLPCICPPGFLCRCQIKTPVYDSNRASMAMFPCICPPGFACRCLHIQYDHDEDAQSCDESVGSCSTKSSYDQWNQSDEEIVSTYKVAQAVEDVVIADKSPSDGIRPTATAIEDVRYCCNCPPGFCRCGSIQMFRS